MAKEVGYPGTVSGGEGKHGSTSFDRDNIAAAKSEGNMSADTSPTAFNTRGSVKRMGPKHGQARENVRGGTDNTVAAK